MDFTLILLGKTSTHILSPERERERWKRGDVVDVWLTSKLTGPPSPDQPFIFVHVTSAPNRDFARIRTKLAIANYSEMTGEIFNGRRRWRVRLDDIPVNKEKQLRNTRETTVSWDTFKTFIQNHRTGGAINDFDL